MREIDKIKGGIGEHLGKRITLHDCINLDAEIETGLRALNEDFLAYMGEQLNGSDSSTPTTPEACASWALRWCEENYGAAPLVKIEAELSMHGSALNVAFVNIHQALQDLVTSDLTLRARAAAPADHEVGGIRVRIVMGVLVPMPSRHAEIIDCMRELVRRGADMAEIRSLVMVPTSAVWAADDGSRLSGPEVLGLPVYQAVAAVSRARGVEMGLLRPGAPDGPKLPLDAYRLPNKAPN